MELNGTYAGVVESASDPEKLGRVKVRVPGIHGPGQGKYSTIDASDLPWAWPSGIPMGKSSASGSMSWLPSPGDQVFVRFLDGEPENPIWEWGPRTSKASADFEIGNENGEKRPVLDYDDKGKPVSKALLSRYDHSLVFTPALVQIRNAVGSYLELNADKDFVLLSTSSGYAVSIANSGTALDGTVSLRTALGSSIELDDSIQTILINGTTLSILATDVSINTIDYDATITGSSTTHVVNDLGLYSGGSADITASKEISIVSKLGMNLVGLKGVRLGSSTATDPVVRLSDLVVLFQWMTMHTHGNGNMGSPTSAPIVPPILPAGSSNVFCV